MLPLVSQPDISPPTVSLCLPAKKKLLRTLIERLSKLTKVVTLRGTVIPNVGNAAIGRLTVTGSSDMGVTVTTFISQLNVHPTMFAANPALLTSVSSSATFISEANVCVSAKKLLCVLDHITLPHSDVALCKFLFIVHSFGEPSCLKMVVFDTVFSPGEALVMYLQLQPSSLGSLTFYLPVLVQTDLDLDIHKNVHTC